MTSRPPATFARSTLYWADALVLRHSDLGEADRLVTLFTDQHGKLRVTARAVRKVTSKLGGHIEPLTRASLQIVRGRSLDTVTQAQATEVYPTIRGDFLTLLHGLHMAELIDRFTQEQEPQPTLFQLLLDALRRLDAGAPPGPLARAFEVQILGMAGFQPILDRCASCEKDLTEGSGPVFFSAQWGGACCAGCRSSQPEWTRPTPWPTLRDLRLLHLHGLDGAAQVSTREQDSAELEALLRWYLRYVLEAPLDTAVMLDRFRASAAL